MKVYYITTKKLWCAGVAVFILLMLVVIADTRKEQYLAAFSSPAQGKTVVIDAGHGGFDSGARSQEGIREDEINLKIAMKLKEYLVDHGVKVVMTRDSHNALASTKSKDMQKRVEIIRNSGADIVVSIHQNKFEQPQYYGAQTFYMEGSEEGKRLAQSVQELLLDNLGRGNKRQIKAVKNLLILKAGAAPSIIVECGFLSNPEEARLLASSEYQDKIAWSIYNGIITYFTQETE
jgi:N-acetylmuramoyl-L-alanine amidase